MTAQDERSRADDYLTVNEVAGRLKISRWKVYELIRSRESGLVSAGSLPPDTGQCGWCEWWPGCGIRGGLMPPRRRSNREGRSGNAKDGRWTGAAYVLTTDGTFRRAYVYGRTREQVHARLVELQDRSARGIAPG